MLGVRCIEHHGRHRRPVAGTQTATRRTTHDQAADGRHDHVALLDRVEIAARRAPGAIVAARAAHLERLEHERSEHAASDDYARPSVKVLPIPGGCPFS